MTISSSLNSAVSGLFAHATKLATISDNIANSSTFGYKRAEAEFNTLVLTGKASSGVYYAGGVRPLASRAIDARGALVATSNALDIAVTGRGMLPVTTINSVVNNGDQPLLMTTTGSFHTDPDGVLRTDSGLVLLGWPANADGSIPAFPRGTQAGLEPVIINTNQTAADPTTEMSFSVNLPATETVAGSAGAMREMSAEYFGNLGTSENVNIEFIPTVPTTGASNQWTMRIYDAASGGTMIGEYVMQFDASSGSGGTLASVTANTGGAYDPATGSLPLTVAGGTINLKIGRIGDTNGMTQLGNDYMPRSTKDGSPVGNLTGVEIDENGFISATYDTGFTRRIYQVPLVDVPNPRGLRALDNQAFQVSPESGSFTLWDAGDGPTGTVTGYAREASTTDVAAELTSLIQTQRAYSSNAKVIQTVDEMLQETTNMKR